MRRIKLFGFVFEFEVAKAAPSNQRKLLGPTCKLSSDGHSLYLTTPDGIALPYQLSCRIEERINCLTKATIELYINNEVVPFKHWAEQNDSHSSYGDNRTE